MWCSGGSSWNCYQNLTFLLTFDKVHNPLRLPSKNDIWTWKSGPNLVCFVHFALEMCFAPQRRALFRHQLPKVVRTWCVLYTFDLDLCFAPQRHALFSTSQRLGHVLRTTTAYTFSTSQLLEVLRTWCAFYILTSKCALRYNDVQFFISHLTTLLRTRRFCEPTFRPSWATNHWTKTQWIATFLPFRAPAFSFFFHFLTSFLFMTLRTSAFPFVHNIVGSLTSKFPSKIGVHLHPFSWDFLWNKPSISRYGKRHLLNSIAFVASWTWAQVPLDFGTVLVHTSWELKTWVRGDGFGSWICFWETHVFFELTGYRHEYYWFEMETHVKWDEFADVL